MSTYLFNQRQSYNLRTSDTPIASFDNWNSKQFFYGKFNKFDRSIAPLDRAGIKTTFESDAVALDFVVDAFNDMSDFYASTVNQPLNDVRMQLFAGQRILRAARGYIRPVDLYKERLESIKSEFLENYVFNTGVKTFEHFLSRFDEFARDYAPHVPMLYSSFVGSSGCPIHCTGLVLETRFDPHNDLQSKEVFLNNPDLDFYYEMAKKFGFVVARHAPWCFVANIQSKEMHEYAKFYDISKIQDIPDEYYYECKDFDIDLLREFLYNCYKEIETREYVETVKRICHNKTVVENVLREPINLQQEISNFDNSRWFPIYMKVLIYQNQLKISKVTEKSLLKEFSTVYKDFGFEIAYNYAEDRLSQFPTGFTKNPQVSSVSPSVQNQQDIGMPEGSGGVFSGY